MLSSRTFKILLRGKTIVPIVAVQREWWYRSVLRRKICGSNFYYHLQKSQLELGSSRVSVLFFICISEFFFCCVANSQALIVAKNIEERSARILSGEMFYRSVSVQWSRAKCGTFITCAFSSPDQQDASFLFFNTLTWFAPTPEQCGRQLHTPINISTTFASFRFVFGNC